ncbi:MAG TPA: response regulator transcription factor [Puia sp.]|jgi:DNA-binding response OmpR family regulator|nr:response regulator transcription factor [Puia sp.]
MYNILLVEDDISLGYILKEYLELHGFRIVLEKDGESAVKAFKSLPIDVCILDVMLPKKDGFAVANEIKLVNGNIPVIFLTARSLKVDKLKGFNLGADDYLVKPVDEEELIARINAVMRRVDPRSNEKEMQYRIGKYLFDHRNQILIIGDKQQFMTVRESAMLQLLFEHRGRILDRRQALNRLWGESDYFTRRSMDVFISHLRKYLSDDPSIEIRNVHGKGYILNF